MLHVSGSKILSGLHTYADASDTANISALTPMPRAIMRELPPGAVTDTMPVSHYHARRARSYI